MKKKYAKIKNYQNAHDTFKYNTERYCQIIAKKYGENQKQVKEYFSKFFDFLNSKGLLTDNVRKRINHNIKTLTLQRNSVADIGQGTMGVYISDKNLLRLAPRFRYNKEHVLAHEFTHLLTSSCNFNKSNYKNISSIGKNAQEFYQKIGFTTQEMSTKFEYEEYSGSFSKEDFKNILLEVMDYVLDSSVSEIQSNYQNVLHRDIKFIPGMVINLGDLDLLDDSLYDTVNSEETLDQGDRVKEKIIINKFINTNFKAANRMAFVVNNYSVFDVNYDGKKFVVSAYMSDLADLEYENYVQDNLYLTEGATELLARMFDCQYQNKDLISMCAYNMNTKYCELLYRIYGDEFFDAFFGQSNEHLRDLMGLDNEEYDLFTANINMLLESNSKEEMETLHSLIMDTIISCFADHLINDIINNTDMFFNSREIEVAIEKSILEFSTSMYDGLGNNPAYYQKYLRQSSLANLYNDCVDALQNVIQLDEVANIIGYEEVAKIQNVGYMSEKRAKDFYSDINFMNDNSYFFTKNNLTQINPTDYLNGKELEICDVNKQEYLRKKAKLPTMRQMNIWYQNYNNSLNKD